QDVLLHPLEVDHSLHLVGTDAPAGGIPDRRRCRAREANEWGAQPGEGTGRAGRDQCATCEGNLFASHGSLHLRSAPWRLFPPGHRVNASHSHARSSAKQSRSWILTSKVTGSYASLPCRSPVRALRQAFAGAAATPSISISIPGWARVGTPMSERAGGFSLPK